MSTSNVRRHIRTQRRATCSAYLSGYLKEHPGVVLPDVALRFLQFGHRAEDLPKFIAAHEAANAGIKVPDHIIEQARAMFRGVQEARKKIATIRARMAEAKRQRAARRINRRAAA